MEKYLVKEEELIIQTNTYFSKSNTVYTHWHSVIEGEIYEHSRLINAIMMDPEYLIFERYDDSPNPILVTIYYDKNLNTIPFIPFGKWKLFQNTAAWGKRKYFLVEDPSGEKRSVGLSEHFPSVPGYLRNFTEYQSFVDFYKYAKNTNPLSFKPKK
jgi:hypothetical protein